MDYRLLVDLEVIRVLDSLPRTFRERLLDEFEKLRRTPDQCCDFAGHDRVGRRLENHVFRGYCIRYWIDPADQQVKVLALISADK